MDTSSLQSGPVRKQIEDACRKHQNYDLGDMLVECQSLCNFQNDTGNNYNICR